MSSYSYGPPPPAPAPAPPAGSPPAGYPHYQQPYQQSHRGGHTPRGGRGGHHGPGPGPAYGYNSQPPQPYGQQSFPSANGPQGSYPPQQWHHDQGHGHPQQPPPHGSLPPQNYHPNYAPQLYQQQPPQYGQQPGHYGPQQQPAYGQYPPAQPQPQAPAPQQWGGHGQAPHGPPFSGGRGRGGHHNDRGGSAAQMMGPPIRIGFEGPNHQGTPAPVSSGGYPQQYGPPQSGPGPYPPAPYQAYPPPGGAPQMGGPPPYEPYQAQNNRHHGRGGHHSNNFRGGRPPHFSGDKTRHKKPNTHANNTHTAAPHSHHQKPDAPSAGKKKKRKTNTLGLTPGEESDEEEIDEEAKLAELIGDDAPNPTDLAAWIAERRKNFPTEARRKAKLAEVTQNGDKVKNDGGKQGALTALEKQQQKLRKQLEKVESSIKRKREQQDEGDEMRDVDASTTISSASKSDDEAPESLPTKPESVAIPPPPKKADPSRHCKYYSTGGTCGKKGKCRFVHDEEVRQAALTERERNGGRITLQQRLILNDKDQEDLTIVKTLQYLKEKGMMTKSESPAAGATAKVEAPSQLPPPPVQNTEPHHSLPPQPPPSVNSGNTLRYQGWNLSGFGNTGVRNEDL